MEKASFHSMTTFAAPSSGTKRSPRVSHPPKASARSSRITMSGGLSARGRICAMPALVPCRAQPAGVPEAEPGIEPSRGITVTISASSAYTPIVRCGPALLSHTCRREASAGTSSVSRLVLKGDVSGAPVQPSDSPCASNSSPEMVLPVASLKRTAKRIRPMGSCHSRS